MFQLGSNLNIGKKINNLLAKKPKKIRKILQMLSVMPTTKGVLYK